MPPLNHDRACDGCRAGGHGCGRWLCGYVRDCAPTNGLRMAMVMVEIAVRMDMRVRDILMFMFVCVSLVDQGKNPEIHQRKSW